MSAELFTVLSKKEQVADKIRGQIRLGKLKPGTRRRNNQELARTFTVSTKSILDAFDILETDSYLVREPGRGVFVREHSKKEVVELCLIGYGLNTAAEPYFANLMRIAAPPYLREGYNFIVRAVPKSALFPEERFESDLRKFLTHLNIDCLLFNASSLSERQVAACARLGSPVIFIGDFSAGTYPNLDFNQIAGDNAALGRASVEELASRGEKIITLYSGSRKHYFYREYHKGAEAAAKAHGCELRVVEFPKGLSSLPLDEQRRVYADVVGKALSKGWTNPGIDLGMSLERLREAFEAHGQKPTLYTSRLKDHSLGAFFERIYERVRETLGTTGRMRKEMFYVDHELIRVDTQ